MTVSGGVEAIACAVGLAERSEAGPEPRNGAMAVALGLDGCMSWMSNGHMPTEGELVGCLLVLGARVGQCVGAPVLALTYAAWLATGRFRT
jgi:hypothetical protein